MESDELCPFCGESLALEQPNKKKKITVLAAIALILCAAAAATGYFVLSRSAETAAENSGEQSNLVSYSTAKAVHSLLPENHQELTIYRNAAKNLSSYSSFQQMMASTSAYLGKENFARLGEEVLYLETAFRSYDSMTQALDADYLLYSMKDSKKVLVDEGISGINCVSGKAVYYLKYDESGLPHQYRYSEGSVTSVQDMIEGDLAIITHASDDESILGFASAVIDESGNMQMKNGYIANGSTNFFDNPNDEVYFLSEDGQHMYVIEVEGSSGRAVAVKYVRDLNSGEQVLVAESMSECSFYGDSGSLTGIVTKSLSEGVMNPVGQLIYFDAATQTTLTISEDAVALVESVEKSYPWLNESSNELLVTEQSGITAIPEELLKGSFHYINEAGSLCAADTNGTVLELYPDFYDPENYVYNSDLTFLSEKDDYLYWSEGDTIYRYKAGSLAAPETVTLDSTVDEKIQTGVEIGYLLVKDGAVLEQSGNTLNLKPFGGPSSTVYDSPTDIMVVGLSEDSNKIYFISEGKLYEKLIDLADAPVVVAENVYKAITVDNGLYLLCDYGEQGGTLKYHSFDGKELTTIRDGVLTLSDTMLQK